MATREVDAEWLRLGRTGGAKAMFWTVRSSSAVSKALATRRGLGDPLADQAIATITGTGSQPKDAADSGNSAEHRSKRLLRASELLASMSASAASAAKSQLPGNAASAHPPLSDFIGSDAGLGIATPLADFVKQAQCLPVWSCEKRLQLVNNIFIGFGPWSCLILFCASLPETYVLPDVADVLQTSGQLKDRVLSRVRATAAMLFPVLSANGLAENGPGVAEIVKVRLIHATIRNLVAFPLTGTVAGAPGSRQEMYDKFSALGEEEVAKTKIPCNQEQLTYVALTLGYVYVRSLRRLGMHLLPDREEAYLHCWNVVAYLLGVQTALPGMKTPLPDTMREAEKLFRQLRQSSIARATAAAARDQQPMLRRAMAQAALLFRRIRSIGAPSHASQETDPRRLLGRALVSAMETAISESKSKSNWIKRCLRPIPGVMVRYLCGHKTANTIGLFRADNLLAWTVVVTVVYVIKAIDFVPRLFMRDFSFGRLITRIVGYQVMYELLNAETNPLSLPVSLKADMNQGLQQPDARAPEFMRGWEMRLTTGARVPPKVPDKQ